MMTTLSAFAKAVFTQTTSHWFVPIKFSLQMPMWIAPTTLDHKGHILQEFESHVVIFGVTFYTSYRP